MGTCVEGKGGISATIIADSIADNNTRIITFELIYPRFIHSEFMTHRAVSKNAASSRAIPVEKMIELIRQRTAMPVHWGKNQAGMSAKEECNNVVHGWDGSLWSREEAWNKARDEAIGRALSLHNAGYHKQIVNRLLEPFTFMKVVATATEWDNLFWLRFHPDAQPEFMELARVMLEAATTSDPVKLGHGWWHTPYFGDGYWSPFHADEDTSPLDDTYLLDEALKISSSCCAQVSYRKTDTSQEKAEVIYDRLVSSKPVHASPFEHQATPIRMNAWEKPQLPGKCLFDEKTGDVWSGNFRGWFQHRQMIQDNVCSNFPLYRASWGPA